METLPNDLKMLIHKYLHKMLLLDVHNEYKTRYKIGVTMMITKNSRHSKKRWKRIFAYIDIGSEFDEQTSKIQNFKEIAYNIVSLKDLKAWERNMMNYRDLNKFQENYDNFNPVEFCIKHDNKYVTALPPRYFYSKPIKPKLYKKFCNTIDEFVKVMPTFSTLKGGNI